MQSCLKNVQVTGTKDDYLYNLWRDIIVNDGTYVFSEMMHSQRSSYVDINLWCNQSRLASDEHVANPLPENLQGNSSPQRCCGDTENPEDWRIGLYNHSHSCKLKIHATHAVLEKWRRGSNPRPLVSPLRLKQCHAVGPHCVGLIQCNYAHM